MAEDDSTLLYGGLALIIGYYLWRSGKLPGILGGALPAPPVITPSPSPTPSPTPGTPPTGGESPVFGTGNAGISFGAVGDFDSNSSTKATVSGMAAKNYACVLGLGDYAYSGSLPSWASGVAAPILPKMKGFAAQGNHDSSSGNSVFGQDSWTFGKKVGNMYFIGCESESGDNSHAQGEVIKAMADPTVDFVIPFSHQNPVTCPSHHGVNSRVKTLTPIWEKYNKKVKLVLSGHNHNYQRSKPINGVTYCCVGTGGRGPYPVSACPQAEIVFTNTHGWLDLNSAGGQLKCTFYVGSGGSTKDSFTIPRG